MALLDKDIREPLFDFLEETYGKVRILEEKTMGRSRADIVMIAPNSIYGIEIKSDADTYTRLSRQVKDYDLYFDYNYVVVGSSHATHVSEHVPDHWGIISVEDVDDTVDFYILRQPRLNPMVTIRKKLEIMWRPELVIIQEWNDMPKYKDKSKQFVIDKIADRVPEKISLEDINKQISDLLFERDYNAIADIVNEYRKQNNQKPRRKRKYKRKKRL